MLGSNLFKLDLSILPSALKIRRMVNSLSNETVLNAFLKYINYLQHVSQNQFRVLSNDLNPISATKLTVFRIKRAAMIRSV